MRIAVHDYAGFAFPLDLSIELSRRGHDVLHVFSEASGGPKASFGEEHHRHLQIANIGIERVEKDHLLKRWLQERRYGDLAIRELDKWHPDVVISGNTPLEAQKKIIDWAGHCSVPSVFWLQDLLSIAARSIISKVSRTLAHFVYAYLKRIEKGALTAAKHIVAITDDFLPYLNQWRIDPAKVSIIPNWGPILRIPVLPRNNHFSECHGLSEKFVILYCGTLGKKQGIKFIVDTASGLVDDPRCLFVVATDDRGHKLFNDQLAGRKLANLVQMPLQSSRLYPYLLAASDVSLITMEASAGSYCVPSKIWSAFCAQKPCIVAADTSNLCARITATEHAGMVVPPGSVESCITAIRRLKKNHPLCMSMGLNARRYAERHFPISNIADAFESIVRQITEY